METARQKWARHVREWRGSGLTAAGYAKTAGINAGTLSHWAWRLGRESRRAVPNAEEVCGAGDPSRPLIEVITASSRPRQFAIELGDGRRVHVPEHFDGEELGRLLSVLEGGR